MKNKKKYIIILIIIVALLILILPKKISDAIQNEETFKSYISNVYGVVGETFKVRRKGSNTNTIIRGVNGYYRRNWIRAYEITTPFMDKPFEIWIDNREHYVYGDNFSEVLSKDEKFQHLYSEWIKKQVGIDDENVELRFTYGGINFSNIKNLSNDFSEVFENSKMYCYDIRAYNIKDLNYDNSYDYALKYKESIINNLFKDTNISDDNFTIWIHLFNDSIEEGEQYYFRFYSNSPNELVRSKV